MLPLAVPGIAAPSPPASHRFTDFRRPARLIIKYWHIPINRIEHPIRPVANFRNSPTSHPGRISYWSTAFALVSPFAKQHIGYWRSFPCVVLHLASTHYFGMVDVFGSVAAGLDSEVSYLGSRNRIFFLWVTDQYKDRRRWRPTQFGYVPDHFARGGCIWVNVTGQ